MAFDDLLNILLVGLLLLVLFFQQRRKKEKQEEEDERKKIEQKILQPREKSKPKEIIKEPLRKNHTHEALSDRYTVDPAYRLDKEKTTSFGKRLLKEKSSIKNGIIISEILKRPYD